ncbi:hypothetical protein RB595_009614 [Gaeumannomyces hyphopodioides]
MDSPAASWLCDNCQVLAFDDAAAGGSRSVDADGNPFLKMPMSGKGWRLDLESDRPLRDSLPDLPDLASSAQKGCGFCSLLRASVLSGETSRNLKLNVILTDAAKGGVSIRRSYIWIPDTEGFLDALPDEGCLKLVASLKPDSLDKEFVFAFRVDIVKGHSPIARWLRIRSSAKVQDRLLPECVAWARSTIERCSRDHKDRHMKLFEPFCPKRLIDVQSQPVKLVLAANSMPSAVTATPQYAALSYCWGPAAKAKTQLKTTPSTLGERMSGIDSEHMTPVLSDAVAATKALGIRYLWVDALCILQGSDGASQSDWEEQAAVMHEIYSHAHVTLGALASDSCTEPFCNPAVPSLFVRLGSSLNPGLTGLMRVTYEGRSLSLENFSTDDPMSMNYTPSLWASRAWTYQERLLSTRLLGFGKHDLFFTCPLSYSIMGGRLHSKSYWDQVGLSNEQWADPEEWRGVIVEYSARLGEISYRGDVLPALSGVAASFCSAMGYRADDYVAGLWKQSLYTDMFWQPLTPGHVRASHLADAVERAARPGEDRLPSWSPFSHGGLVEVMGMLDNAPECRMEALVDGVRGVGTSPPPPFGKIAGAVSLTITGKVRGVPSRRKLEKLDGALGLLPHLCPWKAADGRHEWWLYIDWLPNRSPEPVGNLRMVLIGTSAPREGSRRRFFGLLIHEVGAARPGVFVRVGVFESPTKVPRSNRNFFKNCPTEVISLD